MDRTTRLAALGPPSTPSSTPGAACKGTSLMKGSGMCELAQACPKGHTSTASTSVHPGFPPSPTEAEHGAFILHGTGVMVPNRNLHDTRQGSTRDIALALAIITCKKWRAGGTQCLSLPLNEEDALIAASPGPALASHPNIPQLLRSSKRSYERIQPQSGQCSRLLCCWEWG